jgi:hypothetical protein
MAVPIRIVMVLFQAAVYAAGSAPDVTEIAKSEGPCTNFRWAKYENGMLEILHCDDKPQNNIRLSVRKAPEEAEEREYHREIVSPSGTLSVAAARAPAEAAPILDNHPSPVLSDGRFPPDDVTL